MGSFNFEEAVVAQQVMQSASSEYDVKANAPGRLAKNVLERSNYAACDTVTGKNGELMMESINGRLSQIATSHAIMIGAKWMSNASVEDRQHNKGLTKAITEEQLLHGLLMGGEMGKSGRFVNYRNARRLFEPLRMVEGNFVTSGGQPATEGSQIQVYMRKNVDNNMRKVFLDEEKGIAVSFNVLQTVVSGSLLENKSYLQVAGILNLHVKDLRVQFSTFFKYGDSAVNKVDTEVRSRVYTKSLDLEGATILRMKEAMYVCFPEDASPTYAVDQFKVDSITIGETEYSITDLIAAAFKDNSCLHVGVLSDNSRSTADIGDGGAAYMAAMKNRQQAAPAAEQGEEYSEEAPTGKKGRRG